MSRRIILWNAVTKADRHWLTDELRNALSAREGWIEDFTQFSNKSVAISCRLPTRLLAEFEQDLRNLGLTFLDLDVEPTGSDTAPAGSDEVANLGLNISFVHDDPDFRQVIPAVPG